MKKKLIIAALAVATMALSGCQMAAKTLGGTYTLNLKENEKLINVTWKDSNLWYLTRPMKEDESAETYEFQQSTDFGVMEGKVIIKESKNKEKLHEKK